MLALSSTGAVELTAYATLLLAVVTAALAGATVWMVRLTRAALAQGQREIELSRREVEEAHRPVLVPFQRSGTAIKFRGGEIPAGRPHVSESDPDRQDLPGYSAAFLPIENVGVGPALNVRGEFIGPRGTGTTGFPTEAIAAGAHGVDLRELGRRTLVVYRQRLVSDSGRGLRRRGRANVPNDRRLRHRSQRLPLDLRRQLGQANEGRQTHAAAPSFELQRAAPFDLTKGLVHVGIFGIASNCASYVVAVYVGLAGGVEHALSFDRELVGEHAIWHRPDCTRVCGLCGSDREASRLLLIPQAATGRSSRTWPAMILPRLRVIAG